MHRNLTLQGQQQTQYQQIRDALEKAYGRPLEDIIAQSTAKQAQVAGGLQDRYLAALRGDVPVDQYVERLIAQDPQTLENRLRHRLGAGYDVSTASSGALVRGQSWTSKWNSILGRLRGILVGPPI